MREIIDQGCRPQTVLTEFSHARMVSILAGEGAAA